MGNKTSKRKPVPKIELSENLKKYLLTARHTSGDAQVFLLSGNPKRLKEAWRKHQDEILPEFIQDHPGTRPYAFWICASEQRKQISGSGDGWVPGMAMDSEGLPKYWQIFWNKKNPPIFESQATYLKRHNSLTESEKKRLTKADFEPEILEFEGDE